MLGSGQKFCIVLIAVCVMVGGVEAAEYDGESQSSGVRNEALEKRADNLKIEGLSRVDSQQYNIEEYDVRNPLESKVTALIRLDITGSLNRDWLAKARLEASYKLNGGGDETLECRRIYLEGPFLGGHVKAGRFGVFDFLSLTNGGLLIDTEISGMQYAFVNRGMTITLSGGTIADEDYDLLRTTTIFDSNSDYGAVQLEYQPSQQWRLAAGFHNMHNNAVGLINPLTKRAFRGFYESGRESDDGVWSVGFDYLWHPDWTIGALYAASTAEITAAAQKFMGESTDEEKSYSMQLTYGDLRAAAPGSLSAWLAYRQVGRLPSFHVTYDGTGFGERGVELGLKYAPQKNMLLKLVYFKGEKISKISLQGEDHPSVEKIFARAEFSF